MPETLAAAPLRPMTARDVADEFRATPKIVKRWVGEGLLKPLPRTTGGWLRFDPAEVERFKAEMYDDYGDAA